jgi:hypothetical protein
LVESTAGTNAVFLGVFSAKLLVNYSFKLLSKNHGSWERVGLVSFRVVLEWAIIGWVKTRPDLFRVRFGCE